jgi:hypothetical protein
MPDDEQRRMIGTRRSRKAGLWLLILVAAAAVAYLLPDGTNSLRERGPEVAQTEEHRRDGPVGTSGSSTASGADNNSGPPGISPPPAVQDARAALTGDDDWQSMVGQRVALTIPYGAHVNDVAFWSGSGDDRLLIVLTRDARDGAERQRGEPHTLDVPAVADRALVSGTIERIPHAEAMFSWRLTNHDAAELSDRPIYLRVDEIKDEGNQTPVAATQAPGQS